MAKSICGIVCENCELSNTCNGCAETNGQPFGGAFINIEYILSNGQGVTLWDDNKIYLGNQLCKKNNDRCYGIAADERYLKVSEYGDLGTDAEIVIFKRWN